MFADYSARLRREKWGERVDFDTEYVEAGFRAIMRALEAQDIRIQGFPDRQMRKAHAFGVDELVDELSLLFGRPVPLTHREGLDVEKNLDDDDTTCLVNISAHNNNPDSTPCGLSVTGTLLVNGSEPGAPTGMVGFFTDVSDIPDGWGICDGSNNATGSGLDLVTNNPFLAMGSTPGSSEVTETNTSSETVADHTGDVSGTPNNATTSDANTTTTSGPSTLNTTTNAAVPTEGGPTNAASGADFSAVTDPLSASGHSHNHDHTHTLSHTHTLNHTHTLGTISHAAHDHEPGKPNHWILTPAEKLP